MSIKIETQKLQNLITKSMKGSSNNKMIPITSLMGIEVIDGVITLVTTDATNYLYVNEKLDDAENFKVVVQAELFAKLVSKITSKEITLEVVDDTLYVKGNGVYKIELPLDEEGNFVTYPKPELYDKTLLNSNTIKLTDIKKIINVGKSALDTSVGSPYTGYYLGDKSISTDASVICGIDIALFKTPILISGDLMELIALCDDDYADVEIENSNIVITGDSGDVVIYGTLMQNINEYQIDAITPLLNEKFDYTCKVSKNSVMQLLDRLSLFVGVYDKNEITLTFTENALTINSKKANSTESVEYVSRGDIKPFTGVIDIILFQNAVKSMPNDVIEINFGLDNAISLCSEEVTKILALQE